LCETIYQIYSPWLSVPGSADVVIRKEEMPGSFQMPGIFFLTLCR
jgi:hypothetical protein